MLTLTINKSYFTVKGAVKNNEGETIRVGFFTFNYGRALQEFEYYSPRNGFKGKKQVIVN